MTYSYDDLFTVATDVRGRTFRVLLASGTGKRGFRLEPWRADGRAAAYRGRYVWEGDPLFPGLEAAEAARPRKPAPPTSRFEADFA